MLSHLKFEHKLNELTASRLAVDLDSLKQQLTIGLSHGANFDELKDAQALVAWTAGRADATEVSVVDETGQIRFSAGRISKSNRVDLEDLKEGIQVGSGALLTNNQQLVLQRSLNFGSQVGQVLLVSSVHEVKQLTASLWQQASSQLLALVAVAAVIVFVGTLTIVRYLGAIVATKRLTLLCTVWAVVVLLIACSFSARISDEKFLPVFLSEVLRKTDTVSQDFARRLEGAVLGDIKLSQLPEVDDALKTALKGHGEVAFAAVMNGSGKLLASSGMPLEVEQNLHLLLDGPDHHHLNGYSVSVTRYTESASKSGAVFAGFDHQYLKNAIQGVTLDTLSVMVVAVLVAFEILLISVGLATSVQFASSVTATLPNAGNSIAIRLPMFLFCVSEELSRPFLPAYAKGFASSVPWLSADLVISLPVTLFMLAWAFAQPVGATLSERIGRRKAFFLGAAVAGMGYIFTSRVSNLGELLGWRFVTAIGYGLVFIAAHGAVVDRTRLHERASGMAMLVGAILAAGVCGPILGGLLADKIGYRETYAVSAALVIISSLIFAIFVRRPIAETPSDKVHATSVLLDSRARSLLRNTRFIQLMLLSAIPTKIAATSILFCLVPLLMAATQSTSSDIGRVQMLYYLAFILLMPPVSMVADRTQRPLQLVVLGGVLTLVALFPVVYSETSVIAIAIAIALFGFAQSMIGSPQLTIVSSAAIEGGAPETVGIAWYRLIERLGGALGPILALSIATIWSPIVATLCVGGLCAFAAFVYWRLSLYKS